jgi:hypothetical protein
MRLLVCSIVIGAVLPAASGQTPTPTTSPQTPHPVLSAADAAQHVGENRTVCGQIMNEYTSATSHGTPTFIDLDQPYPHSIFDLVIWGDNKETVGAFPKTGKVCASGTITLYRNRPEILLRDWHSWYVPSDAQQRASVP